MPDVPMPGLLQSQADFLSALNTLAASDVLALDTEFMREQSYRPKLCLVQLGDAQQAYLLDPLALDDMQALAVHLADTRQLKLIHSAAQDLEVLHQRLGCLPAPLFDTQIAATLCGLGEQIGYAALIEQQLGVVLDKSASRTDWAQRPLSAEQMCYAQDDVRYLPALHEKLQTALRALGREAWLAEDCAALLDPARWTVEPQDAWRKIKGWQRAPKRGFPRLRQLAAWRERTAQSLDRPRRWIVDDETLLQLAQRPPRSLQALQQSGLLPARLASHAPELMQVLDQAQSEADDLAPPLWRALQGEERERYQRLADALQSCAQQLKLPSGVLLNRSELDRIAREPQQIDALTGWRAEVLHATLAAVV